MPASVWYVTASTPDTQDARSIERMFADVAPRYDLLNALMSLGRHHRWRARAVALADARPGQHLLDICCGTGDMARALARRAGPGGLVIAVDFCEPMLRLGQRKPVMKGSARLAWVAGDATALPVASGTFDSATVAFGVRNVSDMPAAFREAFRALKPGGRFVCLEFSVPRDRLMRAFVRTYERTVIPALGSLLSSGHAYRYLPRSIQAFPAPDVVLDLMRESGFSTTDSYAMHFGSVVAYRGVRA